MKAVSLEIQQTLVSIAELDLRERSLWVSDAIDLFLGVPFCDALLAGDGSFEDIAVFVDAVEQGVNYGHEGKLLPAELIELSESKVNQIAKVVDRLQFYKPCFEDRTEATYGLIRAAIEYKEIYS